MLGQALQEKVKPVLLINKLDRAFLEKQDSPEEIYQTLLRHIESVNVLLATYGAPEEWEIDPLKGNVAFGSGYFGWAFTLRSFAALYAEKVGLEPSALLPNLWGERYYDA